MPEPLSFDFADTTAIRITPYWSYPASTTSTGAQGPLDITRGIDVGDFTGDGLTDILLWPNFTGPPSVSPVLFLNDGNGSWTEQILNLPSVTPHTVTGVLNFSWNGANDVYAADAGLDDGNPADDTGSADWLLQWSAQAGTFVDATSALPDNGNWFNHVPWGGNAVSASEFDILQPRLGGPAFSAEGLAWFVFRDGSSTVADLTADLPAIVQFRTSRQVFLRNNGLEQYDGPIGSAAFAHLAGAGENDLIVGGYGPNTLNQFATVEIFAGTSATSFAQTPIVIQAPAVVSNPANGFMGASQIVTADLEGTGRPDIIVLWEGPGEGYIQILRNNGAMSFTDITSSFLPDGAIFRDSAASAPGLPQNPIGEITVSDIEHTGFPDLILRTGNTVATALTNNAEAIVYENTGGTGLVPFPFGAVDAAQLAALTGVPSLTFSGLGAAVVTPLADGGPPELVTLTPEDQNLLSINGGQYYPYYALTITPGVVSLPGTPITNLDQTLQDVLRDSTSTTAQALVQQLVSGVTSGAINYAKVLTDILQTAENTTSVATMAYQFFTGQAPSSGGMDYLVSPTGPNPDNLNSAYYQDFNLANRYINFAVNLGKDGAGAAAFQSGYGSLSLSDATSKAYAAIFGTTPTAAKVEALLDPVVETLNGQSLTRADYFATYGGDGLTGLGTKAAMVGWLLAQAVLADVGTYALSNDAFLTDVAANNAAFGVDIVGHYGLPIFAYLGG